MLLSKRWVRLHWGCHDDLLCWCGQIFSGQILLCIVTGRHNPALQLSGQGRRVASYSGWDLWGGRQNGEVDKMARSLKHRVCYRKTESLDSHLSLHFISRITTIQQCHLFIHSTNRLSISYLSGSPCCRHHSQQPTTSLVFTELTFWLGRQ